VRTDRQTDTDTQTPPKTIPARSIAGAQVKTWIRPDRWVGPTRGHRCDTAGERLDSDNCDRTSQLVSSRLHHRPVNRPLESFSVVTVLPSSEYEKDLFSLVPASVISYKLTLKRATHNSRMSNNGNSAAPVCCK